MRASAADQVTPEEPALAETSAGQPPRVTVMIPVRDERDSLPACLESVLSQTEPDLQVLVVDGRSTDGTQDVVRAFQRRDPRVELLDNPGRIVSTGLNIGLAAARAPWLVRVDGHASIPPDYVATAGRLLEDGHWGGVGGLKRGLGRTPAGRAVAVAMSSRFGVGGSLYHYGTSTREVEHVPFGCYVTDVARELGGWDERFVVNQDFEFDHRLRQAGHRLLFSPELVIEWECRQSVGALFRQYRRYGRGKVKVALQHPDSVKPRHLVPPTLVAAAAAITLGAVARGPRVLGLLGPYGLGLLVAGWNAGRGMPARERLLVPGALAAMHVGWGIGFWEGLPDAVRHQRAVLDEPRAAACAGPAMPARAGAPAPATTASPGRSARPAPRSEAGG